MEKINVDNLPEILTPETIDILARMANEFPKTTFEWNEISILLEKRGQLRQVLDYAFMLHQVEEKKNREALMTQDELETENKRRKESIDSGKFSGNMGETDKY